MSRYLTLSSPSGISGADLKRRIGAIMAGRPLRRLGHSKKALLGACGIVALAAPLALGLAASPLSVLARAPASVQSAIGAALGAPTEAKVATPASAPTVAPGTGGGASAAAQFAVLLRDGATLKSEVEALKAQFKGPPGTEPQLTRLLQEKEKAQTALVRQAIDLGASAPDVLRLIQVCCGIPFSPNSDPASAVYVRIDSAASRAFVGNATDIIGTLAIGFLNPNGRPSIWYDTDLYGVGGAPPGLNLPTLYEAFDQEPPAPPPPPAPEIIALGQMVMTGRSLQDIGKAYIATLPAQTQQTLDPSATIFEARPNGVTIWAVNKDGTTAAISGPLPGTSGYVPPSPLVPCPGFPVTAYPACVR